MRIEGTIAVTAAASSQALNSDIALAAQRERVNPDSDRQEALANPDATRIASQQRAVGTKLLATAVESAGRLIGEMDENLTLRIHKDGKRTVVRVVDKRTGEVMREIPADRFVDIVSNFEKQILGLFIDETP